MIYATLKTANNEYKGRLSAKRCVELEKALGKNPLKVFTDVQGTTLPSISDLMTIFHYSLVDLNHNFDEYEIYDEFCESGGDIAKFIEFLLEVFKVSGFIPKDAEKEVEKKNKKSKN